ncbi:recombinase family protein, partial [Shigella flexneri]|uniref:recombinase family protein n=2 Tax=Shigella TaxID=620 RepID=UPI001F4EDB92
RALSEHKTLSVSWSHYRALRAFLEAVKQGLIPSDSVLLVESLDRVSRQSISHAQETIRGILEQGITVVTLSDGETYN